jgi:hypothetical protein
MIFYQIPQIFAAPADYAMYFRIGAFKRYLVDLRFLPGIKPGFGTTAFTPVVKTIQTFVIITMNPVSQCLAIHTGGFCRILA